MNYSVSIISSSVKEFISHWSKKYAYKDEYKYNNNIGKPLTDSSKHELFEWKNRGKLSASKLKSISSNYPLSFKGNISNRYLSDKHKGGAIWNIFYIHCLHTEEYPIFDQHTYRAMNYIQHNKILEIPRDKRKIYNVYQNEYIPFINDEFKNFNKRDVDKALFAFGKFLKTVKQYN